ncbi:MAG: helix-turn-helix domain-containing protein [Prevotella sp.]|jgi:hypothetical protein|nr:helix-turn-helix domain-containing protein [Prevotella sp.]
MTTLGDRLQAVIEHRDITITEFERMAKVSKGVFAKAIKNNTGINSAALEKIVACMPEVNLNWLLTGQGDMLLDNRQALSYGENACASELAAPEAIYGDTADRLPEPKELPERERKLLAIMNNISEAMRRNAIANENNSASMRDVMAIYAKRREQK